MAEPVPNAPDLVPVDLQNLTEGTWPPAGVHTLKVVKCDVQKSKAGNPMLYWEFDVMSTDGIDYRRVWTNTSLLPQALYKLRELVAALGVYPGPEGFKRSECMGKVCRAWITIEQYEGKDVAKPDQFAPLA